MTVTVNSNITGIGSGGGVAGVTSVNSRTGTVTLVGTDIPVFVASGASHAAGAVPDPGAIAGTTNFLREDGTWVNPAFATTLTGDISGTGTGTINTTLQTTTVTPGSYSLASITVDSKGRLTAASSGTVAPTFDIASYSFIGGA